MPPYFAEISVVISSELLYSIDVNKSNRKIRKGGIFLNIRLRMQTLRLLEKMAASPGQARVLGLQDCSSFRGRPVGACDHSNIKRSGDEACAER